MVNVCHVNQSVNGGPPFMNLLVLQISDIHFKSENYLIRDRIDAIKRAVQGNAPGKAACLIAMTGDVAFSGKLSEYAVAHQFFNQLRAALSSSMPSMQIEEVFVPGNHDCDFPAMSRLREVSINDTLATPPATAQDDTSLIETCLQAQDNFFQFMNTRTQREQNIGEPDTTSRLSYTREFNIAGKRILAQCYNTAWMSQLHETPGRLLAPVWLNREVSEPADLMLTLFHHPYNWLEPINGKAFRKQVEQSSDIILTGHEHVSEQYSKKTIREETVD